ncbi:MAG: hypothetical protein OXG35_21715 [Acidobacteria bacterium]|nr:hypothetical protein [Acidobacteriota bacterium]
MPERKVLVIHVPLRRVPPACVNVRSGQKPSNGVLPHNRHHLASRLQRRPNSAAALNRNPIIWDAGGDTPVARIVDTPMQRGTLLPCEKMLVAGSR